MRSVHYMEIPRTGDERSTLLAFLQWQRATLQRKCEALNDDQLRTRAAPPSSLSLLGLARHLADVERGWFRVTLNAEPAEYRFSSDADEDADFNDLAAASSADVFAAWREECAVADRIIAQHQLDDVGSHRTGRQVSLRWILVHMIEEYSRHNGHADLLRERIDGATGYD
jgi:uncharacterized damage-inducible protein DinB